MNLLDELAISLPIARVAAQSLRNETTRLAAIQALVKAKAKPTDKATIAIGDVWLVREPRAKEWWRIRRRASADSKPSKLCLVSGERTEPLKTHPKINGLAIVGGSSMGCSFVSFDKEAFSSFGFGQSENACIGEASAMQYRAGLNALIGSGKKLGSIIVGHWYSGKVPPEVDMPNFLLEPDTSDEADARQRATQLLEAIRKGDRPDLAGCIFYSFSISGAAGRAMLRDWQEGSFESLVTSVNKWFNDLAIVNSNGNSLVRTPKFLAVLGSTVRDLDDLPAPLTANLWRSAINGTKIPLAAVTSALRLSRIDAIENKFRPDRFGLLKAYLVRNTSQGKHMTTHLNPDHPDPAYHAGRLMAIIASIQESALGDVNANVVQRFYPAASATPALIFGRLARLSQFHLAKLEPGLARYLNLKQAEVWSKVQDRLPSTFSLEQQTLFALGYYQQLAHDAKEKQDRVSAKKASTPDITSDQGKLI
ncbi:type I-C CRISPR-associated protein Cas8c/Csd1 [Kamptonema cortianum]|nr:type I-C CRISPR-associated protein Cas8c/Csd1 [Kamptonema cortianum]